MLYEKVPANKCAGWVRVALSYAVRELVVGKGFRDSLENVLLLKGDTDTNGCILGGLIGACIGVKDLAMEREIERITRWRPSRKQRPSWLVPGLVIDDAVYFLTKMSPT